MVRLLETLERRPRGFLILAGLGVLAVIGIIDYLTGYEMLFSVFYLLEVGSVAWFTFCGSYEPVFICANTVPFGFFHKQGIPVCIHYFCTIRCDFYSKGFRMSRYIISHSQITVVMVDIKYAVVYWLPQKK